MLNLHDGRAPNEATVRVKQLEAVCKYRYNFYSGVSTYYTQKHPSYLNVRIDKVSSQIQVFSQF